MKYYKTYERRVENITLACVTGSGSTAVALGEVIDEDLKSILN